MKSSYGKTEGGSLPAFQRVDILTGPSDRRLFGDESEPATCVNAICRVAQANRDTESFPLTNYQKVYSIPGLYEHLFYDKMSGGSLDAIERLFVSEVARLGGLEGLQEKFRVLDLGAGNGLVGERVSKCAHRFKLFERLVGIDLLEEAKSAAERDRAGLYHDYHVMDFTHPAPALYRQLRGENFNCLTSVSRLGFNDISAEAFTHAYNLVEPNALIIFNVRDGLIRNIDQADSDFGRLIHLMLEHGLMRPRTFERYCHSQMPEGKARYFVACLARKKEMISDALLAEAKVS